MSDTLTSKAVRALPWLALVLILLAGSLPAGATKPSWPPWQAVTAVNREGLEAAARKYLSPQEVELLQQAMTTQKPGSGYKSTVSYFEPPLVGLKNGQFLPDLVDIVKSCLARGDRAKVKKFFQVINQQKLIRGAGEVLTTTGGFSPMVIQLELRQSPQKEFQVEVWYRLASPQWKDGKKQTGPRFTYGTGVTAP